MTTTQLQNIPFSAEMTTAEQMSNYTENTFVHLSGDTNIGSMHLSNDLSVDNQYIGKLFNVKDTNKDFRIEIGLNANAPGDSGDYNAVNTKYQAVAIGKNATAAGAASIAIGSNSIAGNANTDYDIDKHFGIAIGYRSAATNLESIAIGGVQSAEYKHITINENGTERQIEVGAAAIANRAVQIGPGINDEANTLKYLSTTIVKDGKVVENDFNTWKNKKYVEIGQNSTANTLSSVAIGISATTNAGNAIAIGCNSTADEKGISIGPNTYAKSGCIAIGSGAKINDANARTSVQLGAGSTINGESVLQFRDCAIAKKYSSGSIQIVGKNINFANLTEQQIAQLKTQLGLA